MTLATTQLSTAQLLSALEGVTAIPCAPYRAGSIDYDAHLKNIRYLMQTNTLSDSRPRVLSIAGTSPLHQMIRSPAHSTIMFATANIRTSRISSSIV